MRLIDAEALRRKRPFTIRGGDLSEYIEGYIDCAVEADNAIKEAPTIGAVPVVHGRWVGWHGDKMVGVDEYRHYHYNTCSECGKGSAVKSNFCPNCGAKMDLENKE